MKTIKKPVFAPFNAANDELAYMDADSKCPSGGSENINLMSLSFEELIALERELVEAVCDWETIIDIELGSSDHESLSNDRRKLQRTKVELRQVKSRIRMMRAEAREELAVA